MLLDLVLWSFMIVLVPLALGLAWQQTASVVQGLASTTRGHSEWPDQGDRFLPTGESDGHHWGRGRTETRHFRRIVAR